jgi:hypothetical protein
VNLLLFLAPLAPATDPEAQMLTDLGNRLDPTWFLVAMLIPAAIVVLWFGNRSLRHFRGPGAFEPRGRPFFEGGGKKDVEFEKLRLRLEQRAATPIAEAAAGTLRMEGTIIASAGTLGGTPGRECVWRNKVGGLPESAVASEAIVIADATGKAGVDNLEDARVTAPHDKHSVHHESMGLYMGDRVEVIGKFVPGLVGDDEDPTQNVFGAVGTSGPLVIRVLERPPPADNSDDDNDDAPTTDNEVS